jgi:photoactive yellow protein
MSTGAEAEEMDSVERLATMTDDEVNELPYGFLILDHEGRVQLYNRYESRMSRLPPERVLGRSWFHEIAPCTRVDAFFGRFQRLVNAPDVTSERFAFRFHFLHGAQDVLVELTRAPAGTDQVYMTVQRRNVSGPDTQAPDAVTHDDERGSVSGPAGLALPLPAAEVTRLFDELPAGEARAVGSRVGRTLADVARARAEEAGAASLDEAPLLLRSGVLDATLARAGFGRLAIDLTAREAKGVIGVTLRPPTATTTFGLALFYEGLLGEMLSLAIGRDMLARCLDIADARTVPWLFAAVPSEQASLLDEAGRSSPESVARSLGLFTESEE